MSTSHIFDAYTTPIKSGINLIEASAGTGKTFTLAALVIRAVVELDIAIERILVVTYTRAATEELRGRIRANLRDARRLIDCRGPGECRDSEKDLKKWIETLDQPQEARRRIDMALLNVDQAPIFTIHSFCQKTLQEQALESGSLFEIEVTGDVSRVRREVVEDFWRSRVYGLDARYCGLLVDSYPTPDRLYRSIAGADNELVELVPGPMSLTVETGTVDRIFDLLAAWWREQGTVLRNCYQQAAAEGYLKSDAARLSDQRFAELEQAFGAGCAPSRPELDWLVRETVLNELNGQRLRGAGRKESFVADWPLPQGLVETYLEATARFELALRLECARSVRTELGTRLAERGLMSFDRLVGGLASALDGPLEDDLRRRMAASYRLVMIDEFQDTDSAQWLVFSRLFGEGRHYLYLIGDPKQAIYRFRGADINSYFAARQRADCRLTLARNFRTNPGLMEAFNHLFSGITVGGEAYHRVEPARTPADGRLESAGVEQPGMIFCLTEPRAAPAGNLSAGAASDLIRDWVVRETARLLGGACRVVAETGFGLQDRIDRAVVPADIAVLVRSNRLAERYRDQFRRQGIPAVLTSKTSVFDTEECGQLLDVMRAVASPGDARLIRTALGIDWFGLDGVEHFRVCRDEDAFVAVQERFQDYLRIWGEAGFLTMILRLLENERVFLMIGNSPSTERRLANIGHLLELVQDAEQRSHFVHGQTVAWLQQKMADAAGVEETELRLESDRDAVQIVTMHSAKGLEYPIVFCPDLLTPVHRRDDIGTVLCHDDDGRPICDLGSENYQANLLRALQEEEEEAMRLAYVAITRAKLRCYLIWADIKGHGRRPSSFLSPLGQLLFPDGQLPAAEQKACLQEKGGAQHCGFSLIPTEPEDGLVLPPASSDEQPLQARPRGTRPLYTSRTRTSFSGLAMLSRKDEDVTGRSAADERASDGSATASADDELPSGVRFGNIVHTLLENHDFGDLAAGHGDPGQFEGICRRFGLAVDHRALQRLLINCVTTPLMSGSEDTEDFTLARLDATQLVRELEFFLRLGPTSTGRVNEIIKADPACVPLSSRDIQGYLVGYVDLICRFDNRFYVVDYKTNNLGPGSDAYERQALEMAMRSHNYGLQYWIYSLVVHRFLRRWLPGYDYQSHFGGVLYLFVRGMNTDRPGSGVYHTRPDERRLQALDKCFGAAHD